MVICLTLTLTVQPHAGTKKSDNKMETESHVTSNTDDAELRQLPNNWKDAHNSENAAKVASLYTEDEYYISSHGMSLDLSPKDATRSKHIFREVLTPAVT